MSPLRGDEAGLYVHIPFCSSICPYCDFAVTTGRDSKKARFVETLLREIDSTQSSASFDTVYFGGGTPSCLDPIDLERIFAAISSRFSIAADAWFFLEANPEHVTPESASAWREMGVRFLSLGIQSFDEGELNFLHRRHDPRTARKSLVVALDAGFETVSVDLIFGLPDQSSVTWKSNLAEAGQSGATHVSCYQLTIHENTVFDRWKSAGRIVELPEDAQADLFRTAHRTLETSGLLAYEVSNFARGIEHRSRHNIKYWQHTPYVGIGPSAHSFDGRRRHWNHARLETWQDYVEQGRSPVAESEDLSLRDLALEWIMLSLRTADGLDLLDLKATYETDLLSSNRERIHQWQDQGLLLLEDNRLIPTSAGLAVADRFARELEIQAGIDS